LKNGKRLNYDFLLIASGGSPLVLPWKGVGLTGVSTLYTLDDAKKVADQACNAKNAVVIGCGSIAMKAIQNFKKIGLKISIVEKASHIWPIGFDRKIARIVENKIKENDIQIYLNEEVVEFRGYDEKLTHVILKSGKEIPADIVVITIGTKPNIDFLEDSNVKIDQGIIVDSSLRTTIPSIFAAGDVAQIYDPLYDAPKLHTTWGNAKKQGRIAAVNMTGGKMIYKGVIPIQTIKIFGFKAIAVGITHSKKNFDEISWVSFEKEQCRKFVLRNNKLIGALVLGKDIDKKILKPLLKNAVSKQVEISNFSTLLSEENLDFETLFNEI
jgi:NAD(P)H-nitrite reductase large subunit